MAGITATRLVCPAASRMASNPNLHLKTLNAPASASENQYLQITGWLTAAEQAAFEPFETFTSTSALPAVPENQIGNAYHLILYDILDNPLTDFYFNRARGTHDQPGDSSW